jgi:hypothetical protein
MVNYQMEIALVARILVVYYQSAMNQDAMPNVNANMEGIGLIARRMRLTALYVAKDQLV